MGGPGGSGKGMMNPPDDFLKNLTDE